jgi:hypothetical protein
MRRVMIFAVSKATLAASLVLLVLAYPARAQEKAEPEPALSTEQPPPPLPRGPKPAPILQPELPRVPGRP